MKRKFLMGVFLLASVFILTCCVDSEDPADDGGYQNGSPENYTEKYSITFLNEEGDILSTKQVEQGKTPSYNYSVDDTAEWDYTFVGWSETENGDALSQLPVATKNASYYAIVTATKQKYTVTFNTNGGSSVTAQVVEYGSKASLPEAPTFDAHKFMGWSESPSENLPVDFDKLITADTEYFALWNEMIDIKGLLSALLNGYELHPLSYIPESMQPSYSARLVNANDIVTDYSSFVNISNVSYGFGEQWHMVIDNLEQSKIFFNSLSVVESLLTTSITVFNNYFDENPSDTAHYEFESGIYNVTINFDGENIYYILDYTADLPVLGNQVVQISLSMDCESGEKNVRVQLGDANALSYKILENSYKFAVKYLGVRRAMFSVERDNNGCVSGKIYEYLTVSSAEIGSVAEFYIGEDYVSVVGNKASGMLGFTGYISELYNVKTGALLGYEVQETLSSIVYNTLWFNLADISGINSIKYTEKNGETPAKIYVNGSSSVWESKNVGGIGAKMFSRRFDIECRTQYVYSYDALTGNYVKHCVEVPMIFIQEEFFESFTSDVMATNGVAVSVCVDNASIYKLLYDYDELIPNFIENKALITSEYIIEYIGNKINL